MRGESENELSLYALYEERGACMEKKGFVVCRNEGVNGER